jgi:hypothetical protein
MTVKFIAPGEPSAERVILNELSSTYGVVVAVGAGRSSRFAPLSTPAMMRLNGFAIY